MIEALTSRARARASHMYAENALEIVAEVVRDIDSLRNESEIQPRRCRSGSEGRAPSGHRRGKIRWLRCGVPISHSISVSRPVSLLPVAVAVSIGVRAVTVVFQVLSTSKNC